MRIVLAAMEGAIWEVRQHVSSALSTYGALTPLADLALREVSYTVTAEGRIVEHARSLPLSTAIRLVVNQATIISPGLEINFGGEGWAKVKDAIAIRNRITHPKASEEILVSDADLAGVWRALSWVIALAHYVMASTNLALIRYNDEARILLRRLSEGDPDALEEYRIALEEDAAR